MTIKELRAILKKIDTKHDDDPVIVWLPGSRIDLSAMTYATLKNDVFGKERALFLEGNVREGSALDNS
jgi:hypothetical protein